MVDRPRTYLCAGRPSDGESGYVLETVARQWGTIRRDSGTTFTLLPLTDKRELFVYLETQDRRH